TSIRLLRLRRCSPAARSSASRTSAPNLTPTPWPLRVPTRRFRTILLVLFLNLAPLSKQSLCRPVERTAVIAMREQAAVHVQRHSDVEAGVHSRHLRFD